MEQSVEGCDTKNMPLGPNCKYIDTHEVEAKNNTDIRVSLCILCFDRGSNVKYKLTENQKFCMITYDSHTRAWLSEGKWKSIRLTPTLHSPKLSVI